MRVKRRLESINQASTEQLQTGIASRKQSHTNQSPRYNSINADLESNRHPFIPRVASLAKNGNQSSATLNTLEDYRDSSVKKHRNRMDELDKRVYDPDADPVVGRDSAGPKYAALQLLGNEQL